MRINYKKELESAAKGMILVHEPATLIKMIVRLFVQKFGVAHAGILLHDKEKNSYVLTVSRGTSGLKIPAGFARMDGDNPLMRLFTERGRQRAFNGTALVYEEAKKYLRRKISAEQKQLFKGALYQMEMLDAYVCIPSYFRQELLGLLLLGNKKNRKKFAPEELDFFVALASDVAMAIRNARLFTDLAAELEKNKRLFIHTTVALAAAIDAKDHYTHGHTARVTNLSLALAKKLSQADKTAISEEFLENLQIASLLHDIGKIGIPESLLNKQGPLTDEERKHMQEHSAMGVTILAPIKELDDAVLGVKYHHERYDGTGYPEGLKAAQIPLIAAVISVADTFDAMTTDRPYRKGISKQQAVEEINRLSGKQFDPLIVSALLEVHREGQI